MNRPTSTIISLSDAAGIVKRGFRDYVALLLKSNSPRLGMLKDCLDYDCTQYLGQILIEIFADQGLPEVFGGISHSTNMLMQAGMERSNASFITLQVHRLVLSQLTAFYPNLVLGPDSGYQYEMCSEYDVFVTPPQ